MTNEKELREEWEKYKKDIEGRPYAGDPFLDFFLSKFHSHTKEVIEKIKGMRKGQVVLIQMNYDVGYRHGYNQAIDDILSSLEDNKK